MISISRSAEVTYSAERMYELVNDIEAYPEFLHWCNASSIIARNDTSLTASLSLSAGGVKKTFTTRNTMLPGRRIDITLLEGPFKHLAGYWLFEPLSEQACRISIKMTFEFKNKLLRLALDKIFSHIINTLIETFTERAQKYMATADGNKLTIEVVYAQAGQVQVISLAVASGTSIRQAIALSGILNLCPEIDLSRNKVGIFGEIREPDTAIYDNCRVEIYRPLLADPKVARRQRAKAEINHRDQHR